MDLRFCLVGARAAFRSDAAWLVGIERGTEALTRVAGRRVVLQVRLEPNGVESDVRIELAKRALERVRDRDPRGTVRVLLNCPGVDGLGLGYDGVHWREDAIPPQDSAHALDLLRSASVHSKAGLRRAESAGVSFVLFGPIWTPSWKPTATPVGLDGLAALARDASVPVFAIGGVTPERVAACRMAGARGVAVASGVLHAPDPAVALQTYVSALGTESFC